jgi:hypothetical protein
MGTTTPPGRPLSEVLGDYWPEVAAFFQERNWPDTKLGNAAAAIQSHMPMILAALERDASATVSSEGQAERTRLVFDAKEHWRQRAERAENRWQIVNKLREQEGAGITFVCDNPDFNELPNCVVTWCAPDGAEADFRGATIDECLEAALRYAKGLR